MSAATTTDGGAAPGAVPCATVATDGGAVSCAAVAAQARAFLRAAPLPPSYRDALAAALELPGNILSAAPNARWARLVWTCCAAAGGHGGQATPAAAAVELFMVAADLLDDAEDDEENPLHATLGLARTLNVATGLLLLATQSLLATDGATAAGLLLDAGLCACGGQHADLAPEAEHPSDLDDALAITAQKGAALVAAASRLGAAVAGAALPRQELYARFGRRLGMAAQLANDLAALHPAATGKTDLPLRRPTLPYTYAVLAAPEDMGEGADPARLWSAAPAYLTWVVAHTYRRHALALIPQLTADPAGRAALAALLADV